MLQLLRVQVKNWMIFGFSYTSIYTVRDISDYHIIYTFICEAQVEFVHLGGEAARFVAIAVPCNCHHEGVEEHVVVLPLWNYAFIDETVVDGVEGAGEEEEG